MLMSRKVGAVILIIGALALSAPAGAAELRAIRSGEAIFHFNVHLLNELGIDLVEVKTDAPQPDQIFMEEPHWALTIRDGSDLKFHTEYGVVLPQGFAGGAIFLDGSILLRERASGREIQLNGLELTQNASADQPENRGTPPLYLRSAGAGENEVFCELVDSMFEFKTQDDGLSIHYLNARITDSWAKAIGRQDLAGWFIGIGEVRAATEMLEAYPPSAPPYVPNFAQGILDVSLGGLDNVQSVGHDGVFPTGKVALSMSTTSCNLGTVDVPWLAPMQEDHPVIHMALYRLLNGHLEQVGTSWMKHGFYALSNSQCTPCQHPSGGQFLGVGCSDTYGVGNNSDRNYLGPREEVNAFLGTWKCKGSHFAGGVGDCVRRHGSSGHGVLDHRLVVDDADLNNAGATYYYEAYYVVRGEQNLPNNWGSRICTMNWNGSAWAFSTPGANNPLVPGPALSTRWGDLSSYVNTGTDDGRVLVTVKTTDLGGGTFHYEYAVLNMESDRRVRSFSIPVEGVANINNIGFHDSDGDATNDWPVTVENGVITWQTETYAQNPDANAIEFGYMFNFRFDADAAPENVNATLGIFKTGDQGAVQAASRGPINVTTGVAESNAPAQPRLLAIHPNPLTRSTSIDFELAAGAAVKLDIYDAAGRFVRSLIDGGKPGAHAVTWDGKGENGDRVRSGVYYARLRAGSATAVKSMVVMN